MLPPALCDHQRRLLLPLFPAGALSQLRPSPAGSLVNPYLAGGQLSPLASHLNPMGLLPPQPLGFSPVSNRGDNPPCNTLFIGNLGDHTDEGELRALFALQPGFRSAARAACAQRTANKYVLRTYVAFDAALCVGGFTGVVAFQVALGRHWHCCGTGTVFLRHVAAMHSGVLPYRLIADLPQPLFPRAAGN